MINLSEKELKLKLSEGNALAFSQVVRVYQKRIFHFSFHYLNNQETAKDVVQDVFSFVWENHKKLSEIKNLSSWLFTLTKNQSFKKIDYLKVRQKHVDHLMIRQLELAHSALTDLDTSPLIFNEINSIITKQLNGLSPQTRRIFEMSRYENMKNREIVGEVMKALEENGIAENTLLVFTSDNGCSNQADYDQLATKGHDPSYLFRGHKADIFEGGHRVPYIVRWPQKVKPGKSEQLLCTTDLFATVADILHVDYADNVAEDSYSFLSALSLPTEAIKRESIVHHSIKGSFAYRKEDWKVCFCPGSGGWSEPKPASEETKLLPPVQLYNLKNDIAEENNLQAKYPEMVREFRKELSAIVTDGRSTKGEKQTNDGPKTWPQLNWMYE